MTPQPPLIQAEHLTRRFGTLVANNDVNLIVQPGEVVGHHLAQDATATMVGVHGDPRQTLHRDPVQGVQGPGGCQAHVV